MADNHTIEYPGFSETIDFILSADIAKTNIDYEKICQFLDKIIENEDFYLYAMPSIILKAAYWNIENTFPEKLFIKDMSRILAYGGNLGKCFIKARDILEQHKTKFRNIHEDVYDELASKLEDRLLKRKLKIENEPFTVWVPVVASDDFVWFDRCGGEDDDFLPSKLYNSDNFDGKSFELGREIAKFLSNYPTINGLNIIATGVIDEERIGRVEHFMTKINCSKEMGADYIFIPEENLSEYPQLDKEKNIIAVKFRDNLVKQIHNIAMKKTEQSL